MRCESESNAHKGQQFHRIELRRFQMTITKQDDRMPVPILLAQVRKKCKKSGYFIILIGASLNRTEANNVGPE